MPRLGPPAPFTVAFLLAFSFLAGSFWGRPACAQEASPPLPWRGELENPSPHDGRRSQPGQSSQHETSYETLAPLQSWALSENPNLRLNLSLTGTPHPAGDVNGDGLSDYFYTTETSRDERTPDVLEDQTGKTALYLGSKGPLPKEPDQFLYYYLQPAGDLNGDGFADALERAQQGSARVLMGSPSGFVETSVTLSFPKKGLNRRDLSYKDTRFVSFRDLDGDGFDDVIVHASYLAPRSSFAVIYGAAELGDLEIATIEPASDARAAYLYDAADLEGDGQVEVVQLSFGNSKRLRIYGIDGRALALEQDFALDAPELGEFSYYLDLWLPDINGNGRREIVIGDDNYASEATYVLSSAPGGTYDTAPLRFDEEYTVPIGDLDGDGRRDFYVAGNANAVAFGPAALAEGLADPVPLQSQELPLLDFPGRLGDLDGDGFDDFVFEAPGGTTRSPTLVRRYLQGASDRSALATAGRSFPASRFVDRVRSTNSAGDFNGDGVEDFLFTRSNARVPPWRVAVFFGGRPPSATPDLTLRSPTHSTAAYTTHGDFDGDGYSDLVVTQDGGRAHVYLGGPEADHNPDHTFDASNFAAQDLHLRYGQNVGDVNADGIDDLFFSAGPSDGDARTSFLFFGGTSLPGTPDVTRKYEAATIMPSTAALGDVNEDGKGDFAVGLDVRNDNGTGGAAHVFFGGAGATFARPDLVLTPPAPSSNDATVLGFSQGLAGGDFNGDGARDIAVAPARAYEGVEVSIFYGGAGLDATADRTRLIPAEAFGSFDPPPHGTISRLAGQLRAVPNQDGPDALLLTTDRYSLTTNALLYRGGDRPPLVLEAPSRATGLGGRYNLRTAIGDFDGDDHADVILTQLRDNNDAARSSRVYRYRLDMTTADTPPPPPAGFAAEAGAKGLSLSWTAPSPATVTEVRLYRSAPGGSQELLAILDPSTRSYTDTSAEVGTRYYYHLKAVDAAGDESTFAARASAFRPPAEVPYDVSQDFGEADETADYRLVAVPGVGHTALRDLLEGEPGIGWTAYRRDGDGGLVSYREAAGEGFAFAPGNGFWIVAQNALEHEAAPAAPTLSPDGTYTLALQEGWNIISNPFGKDIDWSAVQAASGGARQPLWAFTDEGYERSSTFASAGAGAQAYYFYNQEEQAALTVPYAPDTTVTNGASSDAAVRLSVQKAPAASTREALDWELSLTAEQNISPARRFRSMVRAGGRQASTAAADIPDVVAPPGRFEPVSLAVLPAEKEAPVLASAYRPTSDGEGQRFTLALRAPPGETLTLRAEALTSLPSGLEAVLARSATGDVFDLSERSSFQITPEAEDEQLQLFVGTGAFVEDARRQAAPARPALIGSYPSPFRRRVTIAYDVSQATDVRLALYDVLGRQLRVLVDERQPPGRKTASFQARSLSSGVYFFRLQIGDHVETGRLVHVR